MGVNFVRLGAGEPLVLLHGIGHRWQAWLPVMDELSAHHEVVALDLPGFGGSPVPSDGMPRNMTAAVASLGALLAAEGADQPHVAGYSLGGALALELAAAGLVRSATAFAPASFLTRPERRRALVVLMAMRACTFLPPTALRGMVRIPALRAIGYHPLVVDSSRIDPAAAVEDALALRRAPGFTAAARASRSYHFEGAPAVPVTIAWGDRDRILPPHQAERARQLLPHARHVSLPNCGHLPMVDDPERVVSTILETTGKLPVVDSADPGDR